MVEHSDQGWDVGSIPSARSKWPGGGMANAMDGAPPINPGSTPGWASTLLPIGFAQSAIGLTSGRIGEPHVNKRSFYRYHYLAKARLLGAGPSLE